MASSKSNIRRDVMGPFGDLGYIAKRPGHGKSVLQALETRRGKICEGFKKNQELERMRNEVILKDFWVSSDLHSLNAQISRFVDLGLKAHDKEIERKKDKLKVLMLDEESALSKEYIDKAQKSGDRAFETKKKAAEEIQSKEADLQKSYVQKVYERMLKNNCDELRTTTQQENRKALNEVHWHQICEKMLTSKLEKEDEKLWSDLADIENQRKESRFEKDVIDANKSAQSYFSALNEQIKVIEDKKRTDECLDNLQEEWRREFQVANAGKLNGKDEERKKQYETYLRNSVQQLTADCQKKEALKGKETMMEMITINEDTKAAEREKAALMDTKAQMRYELAVFRESLKQYNDSLAAYEKDMEAYSQEQKRIYDRQVLNKVQEEVRSRKDLRKSCVDSNQQKIVERKVKEKYLKDLEMAEEEMRNFRKAQNVAVDNCPRYPGQSSGKLLQFRPQETSKINEEQEKYSKMLLQRQKEEEYRLLNSLKKQSEEKYQKINEIMNSPEFVSGYSMHPFLKPLLNSK